jgi:hypothetical protein
LWKSRPIYGPTHFFVKIIAQLHKNSSCVHLYVGNLLKTGRSNQSPNRRKFAQSDHPAASFIVFWCIGRGRIPESFDRHSGSYIMDWLVSSLIHTNGVKAMITIFIDFANFLRKNAVFFKNQHFDQNFTKFSRTLNTKCQFVSIFWRK